MQFIIACGFMLLIVVIFIVTYLLNKKTDKPDIDIDLEGCSGCMNKGCSHNPIHQDDKEGK